MKKLLYTFIACLTVAAASAQSTIDKQLQGSWMLAEAMVSGMRINVTAQTITFSKAKEAELTQQQRDVINSQKQEVFDNLKGSRVIISGKTIEFYMGNMGKQGTYTVAPYSDAHVLKVTYEDGSADEMIVFIKDKQLHITKSDDIDRDEMVFAK
ncbi:hypothetical protein [Flavobacterium subsaxonicum]|uniref:Lipocalin-like domain-containing protein n=1 Tax=Flavobacterium subsaxonicum WB 4.1-42 = DSM 21790 TaxID=1121898 RepID=A0A0A2MWD2_9FLAO|nr:hypothetical protein [Flavobacterium subsaxonicum]KGO92535.1 hypothetical protein Q766_12195 [Flavobacterium subsaxonicum WB 4.1-42 = DSM 21790]